MKNILVTGVSRGVGLQIFKLLLKKEYCVYGISRKNSDALKELKKDYQGKFFHAEYDLSEPKDIQNSIFKNFLNNSIPIHGFINNAAKSYDDIITNMDLLKLDDMFHINVYSPMIITKYAIRNMLLNNLKGSIVHISSISVHTGYKGLGMYAATKGALEAFSKNTAREWGELGIRSNCVVAGFMNTDMSSSLSKEQKTRIYNRTSLKTETSIGSVAEMCEFLISEKSITGNNFFVDAGTI